jgi:hypothetical protein
MSELISYEVIVQRDQSLWDIAIVEYGSIEGLFSLITLNGFDSLDQVPDPGEKIIIDSSLVFKNKFEDRKVTEQKVTNYDAIVQHDQSIWDLAIQEYGSIEQMFIMVSDNKLLSSLDVIPTPGDKLSIRTDFDGDYALMNYFRNKRQVATNAIIVDLNGVVVTGVWRDDALWGDNAPWRDNPI